MEKLHLDIAKILIRKISKEKTIITYGELGSIVEINNLLELSGYLGDLSLYCFKNGMPLISVAVGNNETGIPGKGFFRAIYTPCRGKKVKKDEEIDAFMEEFNLAKNFMGWDRLIELLDEEIDNRFKYRILGEDEYTTLKERRKKREEKRYLEGREKLSIHKEQERNSKLVKEAKNQFKLKNGKLYCELCGFDFEEVYGEIGKNFIEGHHKVPLSKNKNVVENRVQDIMMLCANCHRIVHRAIEKGIDLEEIQIKEANIKFYK